MGSIRSMFGILIVLCLACSPAVEPTIDSEFQALVDSVAADHQTIPGVALHVDSPLVGISWEGAAGLADPESGTPMTAANPVRIASNTKTFVAVAVLRLMEQGALDLDDPISNHLSPEHLDLLASDGYDTEAITIRHLLTHTSGLFDHTGPAAYTERIVAEPTHRWTRTEQLTWAVDRGEPHGEPGEVYTYCDTGYVLLGEIIARASDRTLATAVRHLVGYDELGMTSTWWEILEPPPPGVAAKAHQFFGDRDVSGFEPYFDLYGGGGIVATVGDLGRLWRGLFSQQVFDEPATAKLMLTTVDGTVGLPNASPSALAPGSYRMGLWEVEVARLGAYRHTGFWGTSATYVPELDLVVTLTINQNQIGPVMDFLSREAVRMVRHRFSSSD